MNAMIERWTSQTEGQYFERKSAYEQSMGGRPKPRNVKSLAKDVVETLTAMANADGGELVIGIEDNGEITGVPHSDDKIAFITGTLDDTKYVQPPLRARFSRVTTTDGLLMLLYDVDWSPAVHHLADGRYLRRFRDTILARHGAGRRFIRWYYRAGPGLSVVLGGGPVRRSLVRLLLRALIVCLPGTTGHR